MFSNVYYRFDRRIKTLGVAATLRQRVSSYNVATGTAILTNNDTPMQAVISILETEFDAHESTETTIFEILLSGQIGVTPAVGDEIIVGPTTYRVRNVAPGYIGNGIASFNLKAIN